LGLGFMAFAQAFTLAMAGPVWGWASDTQFVSRRRLMTGSTLGFGLMMVVTAFSLHPGMLIAARFVNGIFLSALRPLTQSWVADHVPGERRGIVFGSLQVAHGFGGIVTSSITIRVASLHFNGIIGWRIASFVVGFMCFLGACFIYCFLDTNRTSVKGDATFMGVAREVCWNLRRHWKIPTFRVIILQGVVGSIPWRAMGFETMFLLYVGFDPAMLSFMTLATAPTALLGPLIGGYMGDMAASKSKYHGRAWIAIFSAFSGIPCYYVFLKVLPDTVGANLFWYIVVKNIFNVVASWCLAGVNRPVLNDVVDQQCRASIIAWDAALEGIVSAVFGMPFLGFIAEAAFGYSSTKSAVKDMETELRMRNFHALQYALLVMMLVPWIICVCALAGLHWTYESDMQKIAAARCASEETEQTKLLEGSDAKRVHGRLQQKYNVS